MKLNSQRLERSGFADPDRLVGISICLICGMVIPPLGRREGWVGWGCIVASFVLILPFVMLIIVSVFDRIRDAVRFKSGDMKPKDDNEHGSA